MSSFDKILLTNKTIFTTQDFASIWGLNNIHSLKRRVMYLVKTGKLKRLRKGIFSIIGRDYDRLELANRLRQPSYISFETVLAQAGITFQYYSSITLVSNLTRDYEVDGGKYIYRKMKDSILLNDLGVIKQQNYFIASPERALLDTLYLNKEYYFDNLNSFNFDRAFEIAKIYNSKTLIKALSKLKNND